MQFIYSYFDLHPKARQEARRFRAKSPFTKIKARFILRRLLREFRAAKRYASAANERDAQFSLPAYQ